MTRLSPIPERFSDGTLRKYTDVGGYPLIYLSRRDDVLCADCARETIDEGDDDPAVGCDVYWEGPAMSCDRCSAEIESAYGDPDAQESDGDA